MVTTSVSSITELRAWIAKVQTVASGPSFAQKFVDPSKENYAPTINSASYLASKSNAYGWTMQMLYRIMSVSCLVVPSIIIMLFPQDATAATVITYYVQALGIPISSINDFADTKMNLVILGASAIAILVSLVNSSISFPYVIPGIIQAFLTGAYFFANNAEQDVNDLEQLQLRQFAVPAAISVMSTGIMLAALWNVWISNKISIGFPVTFSVIIGTIITVVPFYMGYYKIKGDQRINFVLFGMTSTLVVDTVYLTLVNTGTGSTNATTIIAALTDTGTSTTAFSLVLALLVALYSNKNELNKIWAESRRAKKVLHLLGAFNYAMLDFPVHFATIEEVDWITLSKGLISKNDPCVINFIGGENVGRWLAALAVSEGNCVLPPLKDQAEVKHRYDPYRSLMRAVRKAVQITKIDAAPEARGEAVPEARGEAAPEARGEAAPEARREAVPRPKGRFSFTFVNSTKQTPEEKLATYFGIGPETGTLIRSLNQRFIVNGPALQDPALTIIMHPIQDVIRFLSAVLIADKDNTAPLVALETATRDIFAKHLLAAYGPLDGDYDV